MNKHIEKGSLLTLFSHSYLNKIFISVIIILISGGCSSLPGRSKGVIKKYKEAQASFALGDSQYYQGLYDNALMNYEAALYQFGTLDKREGVIKAYLAMGKSSLALGKKEKALLYYEWALPLAEDLKSPELIRECANHLGNYYLKDNDLDQSEKWYSYTADMSLKDSGVLSEFYRLGGTIAKRKEDYEQALELYALALDIDNTRDDPVQIGVNYYLQGSAYSLMGNYLKAEESLLTALEKDKYYENLPGIAADLSALALVLEKSGRLSEALIYYKRAYLAWKGLNQKEKIEDIIIKIGDIGDGKIP